MCTGGYGCQGGGGRIGFHTEDTEVPQRAQRRGEAEKKAERRDAECAERRGNGEESEEKSEEKRARFIVPLLVARNADYGLGLAASCLRRSSVHGGTMAFWRA